MAVVKTIERQENFPLLEQVAGNGKGRVFELSHSRVSIGRADHNSIVIAHESVSREHAFIELGQDGSYVIIDNGSKNGVVVNGSRTDAIPLRDGDVIQLGAFGFRFNFPEVFEPQGQLEEAGVHVPAYGQSAELAAPAKSKRPLIYGIGALLIGGVLYLNSNAPAPEGADKTAGATTETAGGADLAVPTNGERFKVTDAPEVQKDDQKKTVPGIEDPTLKNAEQEISKLDFNDNSIKEAENYFRRGQREFFSKNWHRAIDAFQTSLAINKSHPLARFYLQSALHEAEIDAKKNMEMGVKYFESLQYSRAIYHFQQVVILMNHRPTEKIIKDCEKYIEISKKRLQAAELFP